jgi:hypothetical protein
VILVPHESTYFSWTAQVHQAIGMIVAQASVDSEAAMEMLVNRAHDTDRSVHDVALDVIEGRLRFDSK